MEHELKLVCSELAKSIQREANLEDIIGNLHERIISLQTTNKRANKSSSDSGYSSDRLCDCDQGVEEIAKVRRVCAMEKASIRLELGAKLQVEWLKIKDLERQINERCLNQGHTVLTLTNSHLVLKDLETRFEDLGRRLAEEKQSNSNFEYLLFTIQTQFQDTCDERDILRDQIVPQLCTKLLEIEGSCSRYAGFSGEAGEELRHDVEAQRDALHRALKALLTKQEIQQNESQKRIRYLESERKELLRWLRDGASEKNKALRPAHSTV